jgi:hypothetical protein
MSVTSVAKPPAAAPDDEVDVEDEPEEAAPDSDNEGTAGDVIDTDDGGAIVRTEDEEPEPADEDAFYENLAETGAVSDADLDSLATDLIKRIEYDKECRKERDKKYAEGIKRTGLGDETPGGKAFVGASDAVHPMLSKATVYYQSHTIGELMPPGGPVKDYIPGTVTPDRVEKARRKVAHMNWQCRVQMPQLRSQLEKLLSQQPLGGSQYLRLVYDSARKRPVPTFIPLDKCYIPEAAADFYTAERRTYEDEITQAEFDARIRSGYYRDVDSSPPSQSPDKSDAQRASDKVEGKDDAISNEDGIRVVYIVEALAQIEDTDDVRVAGDTRGPKVDVGGEGPLPYMIEIDKQTKKIVRLVRNWEEKDDTYQNMNWMVDFEFIPWRGAQSVGLIHLAGSLVGGATGAMRALLDSALVNNLPTVLKLKGTNSPGQTLELNICQVTEVEGGVAMDDIRKLLMAVPFNPPSSMLFQLLGFLTEQGEGIVRTTFENLADDGQEQPVGTTLALIEQGMKVLCAIHGRLHAAMDRFIGILHRINRLYITDDEILDDTGEMLAYRADYEGPVDVMPVSDPQVFSDVQRFAQLQIISQRAQLMPQLYDLRKVEELILERTKLPNATDLLLPKPQVQELNAVNENVALAFGQPVAAFPEQDHLAHIQVLLDFLTSPIFGSLAIIAPTYIKPALVHLKEHIVYWYLNHMVETVSHAADADIGKIAKIQDKATQKAMDQTLAAASPQIVQEGAQVFAKIPAIIQQAQAVLQKLSPPPPQDPVQGAIAVQNSKNQGAIQVEQTRQQGAQAQQQSEQQADAAKAQSMMQQTILEQSGDTERTQAQLANKTQVNAADNATALEISAAKVETGHSTNLSTGTGIAGRDDAP